MSGQRKRLYKEISLSTEDESIVILDGSLLAFKKYALEQCHNSSQNVTMNCHHWI
jgi:hypothetical protein